MCDGERTIKSILLILAIAFLLPSCMTVATLNVEYEAADSEVDECAEYCSIRRVYSGVSMDICLLSAGSEGGQGGAIAFWDLPFSFIADTIVLPYTAYKQISVGGRHTGVLYYKSGCEKNT